MKEVNRFVVFACCGSQPRSIEMGLRDPAEIDRAIYSFVPTTQSRSSEKGQRDGDNDTVDGHVRRPSAMHILPNVHRFTITPPSCLHYLWGVFAFPLSSLLQKSK